MCVWVLLRVWVWVWVFPTCPQGSGTLSRSWRGGEPSESSATFQGWRPPGAREMLGVRRFFFKEAQGIRMSTTRKGGV